MKVLRLSCRDASELRTLLNTVDGSCEIFCPTTLSLEVGADVVVELLCKALPNRVMLAGKILSQRPARPRLRIRAGATVRLNDSEQAKIAFVQETLDGLRPAPPRRKHARIPIGLRVQVKREGQSEEQPARLREISINGALIEGVAPLPLGTSLTLTLVPPGSDQAIALAARVLYHAGEDGTGIKFLSRDAGGARRLRELVRRFLDD